ncbi:MAG: hypothetical protein LZF61_07975 [Nitrosomonas sp.]|nr:MAG: hypothetical protein LZF61_07975 [Nitrosomonas sp.]
MDGLHIRKLCGIEQLISTLEVEGNRPNWQSENGQFSTTEKLKKADYEG